MYVSIGLSGGGLYAHEHLAAGGLGRRQVADDDVFGRAGLVDVGGFHGLVSFASATVAERDLRVAAKRSQSLQSTRVCNGAAKRRGL